MSNNVMQYSFSAGQLSPTLFARVDIAKYKSGAARLRNFFVDYRSGASTRTGSKYIIQALISNQAVRVVEFQYSVVSTYILEFGHQYIRFITEGGAVLEDPYGISGATSSTPGQITAVGNNFVNGDWVYVSDIVGAIEYNNRFYSVTVSGSVVTLYDIKTGNVIDASTFGTWTSGGEIARVYKITSPYSAADLFDLNFTQSASVLTITHPSYAPRTLSRVAATNWTLALISFATSLSAPTNLVGTASGGTGAYYSYVVTAVDSNGQESVPSTAAAVDNKVNMATTAGSIVLTWDAVTGASYYNLYKAIYSISGAVPAGVSYGFIGFANGTSFVDTNIVPDLTTTPPIAYNPFASSNNPKVSAFYQQRQVFATSLATPNKFWMSQPGIFNNFNKSNPIKDDDSIEGTLVSSQVNEINSLVSMPGGLLALTAKGAWQISGGQNNIAVTPINIVGTPQAYNGASSLIPLLVGDHVLYVQAKGSIVRDLAYNIYANIYTGKDISVLANDLFLNHQIVSWCYAEEPFKIIWAVRDDGVLLSLTFVNEQEIVGWAYHDTLGIYESVASITEGEVDAIYAIVRRKIGGIWLRYIERFANRAFPYGSEDAWAVDAGVTSTLPTPAANLTASVATGTVTFIADAAVFTSADVGKILRMGGGIANIEMFISATSVSGLITKDITDVLPDDTPKPVVSGDWSLTEPFTTFLGLDHLEGQSVSILADGGVVAPQVVTNGEITLLSPATKVTAGLGFTAQLQTLRIDTGDPTIQGKRKSIPAVTVRTSDTRGLYFGTTFDDMTPAKELYSTTVLDEPSPLITGDEYFILDQVSNTEGQVCFQITDPLPATILGVIPEVVPGDTNGKGADSDG